MAPLVLAVGCAGPTTVIAQGSWAGYRQHELFPYSDIVAIVRVGSVVQRINAPDNKPWGEDTKVYHVATVEALRTLKGESPSTITQVGGQVGDFEYRLVGSSYLEAGETYLVFLDRWQAPERDGTTETTGPIGNPQEVVFVESSPGVYTNLAGTYEFTVEELEAAATGSS